MLRLNFVYIDEFIDFDENSVNTIFIPGDQFEILGHKIKIAGDDPGSLALHEYFEPNTPVPSP
ncbi:MAG: hypothetical protein FWG46_01325 [Treponema sp.]|nr:hypothetical protein [Treponema sp.]